MKPLVLGEAPSRTGDPYWRFPLSGAVGQRLATWAGLALADEDEYATGYGRYYWPLREAFDLANVVERWPGAEGKGKGAAFPRQAAREGLERLRAGGKLPPGRVVVMLGRRVSELLVPGVRLPFYRWAATPLGTRVCSIPHPSGLTREYNDGWQREAAGRVLRRAIERSRA